VPCNLDPLRPKRRPQNLIFRRPTTSVPQWMWETKFHTHTKHDQSHLLSLIDTTWIIEVFVENQEHICCCSWTALIIYALAELLKERSFLDHTKFKLYLYFLSKVIEPVKLLPYISYNQKVSYTKTRPQSEHSIDCDKNKLLTNIRITASQMYFYALLITRKLHAANLQKSNFYISYKKLHKVWLTGDLDLIVM
jgi:hypothetical protein